MVLLIISFDELVKHLYHKSTKQIYAVRRGKKWVGGGRLGVPVILLISLLTSFHLTKKLNFTNLPVISETKKLKLQKLFPGKFVAMERRLI